MALCVERTFRLWRAAQDKEWICLSLSAVKSWTSWEQKLIHGGTWCISSSCEMTSWRKGHKGTWEVTWEVTEMGGKNKNKEKKKKGKDTKRGIEKCSLQECFRYQWTKSGLVKSTERRCGCGMKGRAGWVNVGVSVLGPQQCKIPCFQPVQPRRESGIHPIVFSRLFIFPSL